MNRGRGENPGGKERGGGAEEEPALERGCGIGPVLMATPKVEEDDASTGENSWTGVKKTPPAQWGPKKRRLRGRGRR